MTGKYEEDGVEERSEPSLRNSNQDIESLSDLDLNHLLKKALNQHGLSTRFMGESKYFHSQDLYIWTNF